VVRRSARWLGEKGCATPRLDAEVLIAHALGVDRLTLYTDHDRPLTPPEADACRALVARRGRREPVAYITGRRGFRRLDLIVGPGVLVPRPETEVLVEWAVAAAPEGGTVCDWGTGSGAVALAVADERPDLGVVAVERSPAALAVAHANLAAHPGLAGRVEILPSDGFSALAGRRFDVVAANPPYVAEGAMAELEPELAFEPREALVSGPTGLEALTVIARDAPSHLAPGGWLLAEVGQGQAQAVAGLWREAGLGEVTARADLAGIPRVVGGRLPA
jgi:release factor glutamine methyltransferase